MQQLREQPAKTWAMLGQTRWVGKCILTLK